LIADHFHIIAAVYTLLSLVRIVIVAARQSAAASGEIVGAGCFRIALARKCAARVCEVEE
jgi:hypothetical protein